MSVFDFVQRHIDAIKHSVRNVESEKIYCLLYCLLCFIEPTLHNCTILLEYIISTNYAVSQLTMPNLRPV